MGCFDAKDDNNKEKENLLKIRDAEEGLYLEGDFVFVDFDGPVLLFHGIGGSFCEESH